MKIDTHQHFWNFDPVRDAWIDNSMQVLQRDYLPQELKPLLDAHQFDGCIAVQADQSEAETEYLLNLAKENDFIKGVVGWVDLKNSKLEERLEYFSQFEKLKGIRHIVQAEADGFMVDEEFQKGISKLSKFGLLYEVLIFSKQLPEAINLIKQQEDAVFVIDHIAKPNIKEGEFETWKKQIQEVARFPNVHCKVSGIITEADWDSWTPQELEPYLDTVFEAFGVKRTLFGSDWPVCLVAGKYQDTVALVENYISRFSEEEQKQILGRNAVELYNLK